MKTRQPNHLFISSLWLKRLAVTVQLFTLVGATSFIPAHADDVKVHQAKLPSGQQVYVQEIHTSPVVTVNTWVNTGSAQEVKENNGVSHFLEHLLFKGTDTHKPGEIDRILESNGSEFNAATSKDFTYFYITTTKAHLQEALKLHADMLLNANLPEPDLDQERKVVQEEINRAMDNPQRKAYVALEEGMYPGHPYSMDTLGPKSNIAKIPRANILGYYQQWYQPKNFKTVVVGDVSSDEAVKMVQQAFNEAYNKHATRPAPGVPHFSAVPVMKAPQSKIVTDPNVSLDYFDMAFTVPSIEDRKTNHALDLAAIILGQGRSSRLYQQLKENKQLVTDISAANETGRQAGMFIVNADVKPENREAAKKETLAIINDFKAHGVTADELTKAKNQVIKSFDFSTESTAGVANSIGYNVTIGDLSDYTNYVNDIKSVTAEDVQKAAQKWLDLDKSYLVEMVPNSQGQNLAQQAQQNVALLKADAAGGALHSGTSSQAANAAAGTVTKVKLAEGTTLLMKPIPNSKTVAIHLFAKGGQLIEPKPGVAALTANLLDKETQNRTQEEMSSQIDKTGINLNAGSGSDYFEIKGSAVSEDMGQMMMFLDDVMHNPKFDPQQLEKERAQMLTQIKASRDVPSNLAFENLTQTLYPHHPYGAVGEEIEKSLPSVSRDDVVNYYHEQMQPKNLVISVVGNFDPEVLQSNMAQIVSSLPKAPKDVDMSHLPAVSPLTQTETVQEQKPEQAAVWVTNGWLAPPISDNKDYVGLKVINTLMGEGMTSRLFVNLREKEGLAYQVGSMFPSTLKGGRFVIYIGTDPKNESRVQEGFNQQIQELESQPIAAAELERVKSKLIGTFELNHESNADQAFYLGLYETLGVGYDFDKRYPALVEQITPADVQEVAKKIFEQPKVISKVVPEKVRSESSQAN